MSAGASPTGPGSAGPGSAESSPTGRPAGGWRRWIVTLFGAGMSPVAPGTAGSLLASLLFGAVYLLVVRSGVAPFWAWNGSAMVGILVAGAGCVALGPWTARFYGRKDPGPCVLDEAAGICLTAIFLPIYPGWRQAWVLAAVFAAFRVFDILKPSPAKQLEKFPAGWGILLDDLMAAVYANVLLQVIVRAVT